MTYQTLDYAVDQGVLTLKLSRPAQLNAFTVEMANELVAAFERASEDDGVGAIVVTGNGRAFCAGMDLSRQGNVFGLDETLQPTHADMQSRLSDPEIFHGVRDTGGRVTLAIYACKKPVIAAINGAAVGIGATMTLAMDIRLASETAKIGFVFGKLGIVPEACSTWFLPRIVGISQALEWLYGADIFDAQEAQRGGLVDDAFLQPEIPDAEADAAFDDARDMLGSAKHVHDIRQPGQAFQVWIGPLAQHLGYQRAHRDDAIAGALQAARNAKTGARRVGRQTYHGYTMHFAQQAADFIGGGVGELHGKCAKCCAAIIYHRDAN